MAEHEQIRDDLIRQNISALLPLSHRADNVWEAVRREQQDEDFEDSDFLVTVKNDMNEIDREIRRMVFDPDRFSDFQTLIDKLHEIEIKIVKGIIAYNEQLVDINRAGLTKAQQKGHYALFRLIADLKEKLETLKGDKKGDSSVYLTLKEKLEELKIQRANFENQAEAIKHSSKRDKTAIILATVAIAIGAVSLLVALSQLID